MKESSARLSEEFNAKTADLETRLAESQKEKTAVEEKAKSAANNAEQLDAQLAAKLSEMAILNEVSVLAPACCEMRLQKLCRELQSRCVPIM